jgi:hypothetical protein
MLAALWRDCALILEEISSLWTVSIIIIIIKLIRYKWAYHKWVKQHNLNLEYCYLVRIIFTKKRIIEIWQIKKLANLYMGREWL